MVSNNSVKMKTFYNPCHSRFNALFKGYVDNNKSDTTSCVIETCSSDQSNAGLYLHIGTLSCGRYYSNVADYYLGFKQIVFNGGGNAECKSLGGRMLFKSDTLEITYHTFDNGFNLPSVTHVFKSIK